MIVPFANAADEVLKPQEIGVLDKAKNAFWKTFTGRSRVLPIFGTAIFDAAKKGNVDDLKSLLKNKENIEAEDGDGWTPLLWAVNNKHLSFVEALLSENANINNKGGGVYNPYPLSLAVENKQPEMVKILLNNNPDVEVKYRGKTPLIMAALLDQTEIAKDLLDHKAQVDAVDTSPAAKGGAASFTALSFAVGHGNEELTQLLLERGANTDAAMTIAKNRGRLAIINLLRQWSIITQKRLSDADVARLGSGEAAKYYEDFKNYALSQGKKAK